VSLKTPGTTDPSLAGLNGRGRRVGPLDLGPSTFPQKLPRPRSAKPHRMSSQRPTLNPGKPAPPSSVEVTRRTVGIVLSNRLAALLTGSPPIAGHHDTTSQPHRSSASVLGAIP
jgi:hypothetical protein